MKIYVEGGGNSRALRIECRRGFSSFLKKAGFDGKMPGIVACGARNSAYDHFCTAAEKGHEAILLVDSENSVSGHRATRANGTPGSICKIEINGAALRMRIKHPAI